MLVGLIDVDNHGKRNVNFPNIALMKISAYHKAQGDTVEWWWSDFVHYDIVYMSKVFSKSYTADIAEPINADKVIKGGTGYCISTLDGKEIFDTGKHKNLPYEIEHIMPDYSLYGITDTAYGYMSRGCIRNCGFCHVCAKEGRRSLKVADLSEFWSGQKYIELCDPNTLACRDWKDILMQLAESKAMVDFNQGVDIRLLTDEKADYLRNVKIKNIHFAWDNANDNLADNFKKWADACGCNYDSHGHYGTVFVLTNYNSTMDENLYRIYKLRELGYRPYCMIYDKNNAPEDVLSLQRWVNNPKIFYSTKRLEDYDRSIG